MCVFRIDYGRTRTNQKKFRMFYVRLMFLRLVWERKENKRPTQKKQHQFYNILTIIINHLCCAVALNRVASYYNDFLHVHHTKIHTFEKVFSSR